MAATTFSLPLHQEHQRSQQPHWPNRMATVMCAKITARVEEMLKGSRLKRSTNQHIALIRPEIDFVNVDDKVLGSGSFSQVTAVTTRDGRRYALKHLKRSLMDRQDEFQLAAAELACEAHILSSLDHPNILKIKGWAENGIASFETGQHNSFFLMLDLLDETLNQRIERWRDEQEHHDFTSMTTPIMTQQQPSFWRRVMRCPNAYQTALVQKQLERNTDQLYHQTLYLDKLRIVKEIASAIAYIHSNGIIFRDLKPNNIGFIGNKVQIFDFGLSRELPALDTSIPFAMSGKVGTLRYMAPEVARHQHYNVSADVYSFAMVSYELLSLEKPFDGWTRDMHADLVCNRGVRPDTIHTMHPIPAEMTLILQQAWSNNPTCRGTMSQICAQVQYLESQQIKYLAEQQLQVDFQQQLQQQQQQQQRNHLAMVLTTPAAAHIPIHFSEDMSYGAPSACHFKASYPRSSCVSLDDSMGTIEKQLRIFG
ncbi:serine/threonine protein kinase [Nitzschia inconspicua]|uniref:Serine/threonine protein kinase n=1 Tax=Nitzschia inconspicua TaxID=303405 RepID=A0A9K3KZV2_9STRA|nr:serine/threonine protein kinase [Nitzschia inconspicua]